MERLRKEEEATSAAKEKERLGQMVQSLEQELADKLNEQQTLQVTLYFFNFWSQEQRALLENGEVNDRLMTATFFFFFINQFLFPAWCSSCAVNPNHSEDTRQ